MFKNYPAEQLNDKTLKQMLMVHPVQNVILSLYGLCLAVYVFVLSEGDIVLAESTDII